MQRRLWSFEFGVKSRANIHVLNVACLKCFILELVEKGGAY